MTSGILLLGTGPSSGVPQLQHLMTMPGCVTCAQAAEDPPNRHRRDNICALVIYQPDDATPPARLLLDMGKTFRSSALRWFKEFEVDRIDAVALTHGHADAVGGLDDIRDIQGSFQTTIDSDGIMAYAPARKLKVYLSQATMDYVTQSFDYIVAASKAEVKLSERRVGVVDFDVFEEVVGAELNFPEDNLLHGLSVRIIPLHHGGDYVCTGFVIGQGRESVVYLSDVSEIPPASLEFIDNLVPFKVLVIDALAVKRPHFSHLCFEECLDFVKRWCPEETFIIGYSCRFRTDQMNRELKRRTVPALRNDTYEDCLEFEGQETVTDRPFRTRAAFSSRPVLSNPRNIRSVQLAHDGQFVPCNFI